MLNSYRHTVRMSGEVRSRCGELLKDVEDPKVTQRVAHPDIALRVQPDSKVIARVANHEVTVRVAHPKVTQRVADKEIARPRTFATSTRARGQDQ